MRIKRRLIALGLVLGMLAMGACDGPESTDTENTTGAETMEPAVFDESNPVIYLSADAVSGNGMQKTPFGDVKEALDCAKALAADGAKHITLNFDGGNYSVTEELQITGADFGSTTLEFICEDEEMAVIGAWLPVTGFTETQVNGVTAWVAPMPKINGETIYSHQFFTQEKERLTLPCYPEDGSMLYTEYMAGLNYEKVALDDPGVNYGGDHVVKKDAFYFKAGDLPTDLTRLDSVYLRMLHGWNDARVTVQSIDHEQNMIRLNAETGFLNHREVAGGPARYYLENVYECLNEPGEVYNDRESGMLYYVPCADDSIEDFAIYASTTDAMITVTGMHGTEDAPALKVFNIGLEGSDWKSENRYTTQAADDIPAAVTITDSSYLVFERCSFDHIGDYVVEIKTYVHHVTFDHCSASDIGGGGFRIQGANVDTSTGEVPHDITITDCTIDGYGRVHNNAIGVLLQYAYDCTISHNTITDGYYTGISVGWMWTYGYHATSNILVEKNHVYNIGQGLLSDMGGIYTLGEQPGTVIRGNLFHDVSSYDYGGGGIYTDQASSYILIEKNIVYDVDSEVYHHHFGISNTVRNNIFAFADNFIIYQDKRDHATPFHLERNIIISDYVPVIFYTSNVNFTSDSNLMYDYSFGDTVYLMERSIDSAKELWKNSFDKRAQQYMDYAIKKGFMDNAVIADPLFADPKNGDFTLAENSPAWDIGFEPIDISDVGPR